MLRIHRTRHEANFTILPNAAIRDDRLSYTARGILMELLSRPQDWQTNADALWRNARRHRGDDAEGRRSFRQAFAELETCGYLVRTTERQGSKYVTIMDLYDVPRSARGTGFGTSEGGTSESGTSETGTSLRRTDDGSTDVVSTEDEESSEFADAHSAAIASDRSRETEQQQRRDELNRRWRLVDEVSPEQLRAVMLKLEQQRPTIYRAARQSAINQLKGDGVSGTPKGVDSLACKFAIMHYFDNGFMTPGFLAKPLGLTA